MIRNEEELEKHRMSLKEISREIENYMKEEFLGDFQTHLFKRLKITGAPHILFLVETEEKIKKVLKEMIIDGKNEVCIIADTFDAVRELIPTLCEKKDSLSSIKLIIPAEDAIGKEGFWTAMGFDESKLEIKYISKEVIEYMQLGFNESSGAFAIKFGKEYMGCKNVPYNELKSFFDELWTQSEYTPLKAAWKTKPKLIAPKDFPTLITRIFIQDLKAISNIKSSEKYLYFVLSKARFLREDPKLLGEIEAVLKEGIQIKIVVSDKEAYENLKSRFKDKDIVILSEQQMHYRYVVCNVAAAIVLDMDEPQHYVLLLTGDKDEIATIKKLIEQDYLKTEVKEVSWRKK